MVMLFLLLALHLVSICDHGNSAFAQSQDSNWKYIKADDSAVTWIPPLKTGGNVVDCLNPQGCRDEWRRVDLTWLGSGSYIVTGAPSHAKVSLTFHGTAIEVYGGASPLSGIGLASIDGVLRNISFKADTRSRNLTTFSNLSASSSHTLTIVFNDSPETVLGFEYFRVQEQLNASPSQTSSSQTAEPKPSGKGPSITPVASLSTHSGATMRLPPSGQPFPGGGNTGEGDANSAEPVSPNIPVTIINSIPSTITPLPSAGGRSGAEPSTTASGYHGLKHWQIALLVVLGLITLFILCFLALRYWRRSRIRSNPLVLDNSLPVEVKSVLGTVALDNREVTPSTGPDYVFTRPGSSVSTWRDQHWRNSRIGVSPYLYQLPAPYPESTTDQSSHIDPVPIPARRSMLATQPLPGAAVVRQITFSTKGRVLKVQNPDFRSNASTTETETPH